MQDWGLQALWIQPFWPLPKYHPLVQFCHGQLATTFCDTHIKKLDETKNSSAMF